MEQLAIVCIAVLVIAFLYSSVGHAGASGYIAVMTLVGYAPDVIKPTALVLNILVACLSSWQFRRAGYFQWSLFWPFAVLSVPFAFLGGYVNLPVGIFKILVGVVLLYSAFRFLVRLKPDADVNPPSREVAMPVGAGLGLLSGLTGTGGGIFLTPLLIFMQWARTKTASATSAVFILVNSVAGLLGNLTSTQTLPSFALLLIGSVILGGAAGSYYGSSRFSTTVVKRMLAVVLTIAGLKLIFA
jgi:uncharacterized membrane protein YfcA